MHLGFEYYGNFKLGTTDAIEIQVVGSKWSDIVSPHTKLVVLGNNYWLMPIWEFEMALYKKYKKENQPLIFQHNIPVMLEKELWKVHRQYPEINNNTRWEREFIKPEYLNEVSESCAPEVE